MPVFCLTEGINLMHVSYKYDNIAIHHKNGLKYHYNIKCRSHTYPNKKVGIKLCYILLLY